jgi:hypothetical protein
VTREFSFDPRWIRRFGDYLCLLKICCLFAHETFVRLCQRGKSAAWPWNLSILWIIAFPGIWTGHVYLAKEGQGLNRPREDPTLFAQNANEQVSASPQRAL